mmetsp:Transcript_15733/g.18267  ORF Transcript_15733/g.18267 Transcript_15733/m.18267 type:complete len:121 (+) Transcript_15733:964-1326(+)
MMTQFQIKMHTQAMKMQQKVIGNMHPDQHPCTKISKLHTMKGGCMIKRRSIASRSILHMKLNLVIHIHRLRLQENGSNCTRCISLHYLFGNFIKKSQTHAFRCEFFMKKFTISCLLSSIE